MYRYICRSYKQGESLPVLSTRYLFVPPWLFHRPQSRSLGLRQQQGRGEIAARCYPVFHTFMQINDIAFAKRTMKTHVTVICEVISV